MFEPKEEIAAWVDTLYAVATKLSRGQVLTHVQVRRVLKIDPHEGSWDHVVNKVRRKLLEEEGIATWPERDVGYKLLTESEQIESGRWRTQRAFRQVRRGLRQVELLPADDLSDHQRRSRVFMGDRLREQEQSLRRQLREQAEILHPTPTMPRRAVPEINP